MQNISKIRYVGRLRRKERIRKKINGTPTVPRLCVRRTLSNMIAQIVDDVTGKSLVQLSTTAKTFQEQHGELTKTEQSQKLGAQIAAKAKELGIERVVFDRGGYIYHGRIKAIADGAREAGLQF